MPMIDIQRKHAEVFRVRLGEKGPNGAPRKLTDSIRITSANRLVVEAFVDVYDGKVTEWDSQWQAHLPTTELRILVLPGQSVQQWWEKYRGSVCERRCDGYQEQKTGKRCVCPEDVAERMKDKDACSPTTRVSVLCPDVNVVGAGSLVTHGLIAAETLPQSIAVAEAALQRGYMVPAVLRVVEHKGRTHFIVPQIEIVGVSLNTLTTGDSGTLATAVQPEALPTAEAPRLLEPVPATVEETPVSSIAEQAQTFPQPTRRSNAQQAIPETGIEPRTLDQAAANVTKDLDAEDVTPWDDLVDLLTDDPKQTDTMAVLEEGLRKLYRLMGAVDLWQGDALHAALKKHAQADHVADLRKAELHAFCTLSWNAARDAVKTHNERPFEE